MRAYEHTPLANVQAWSELGAGNPLFQSTVRFDYRPWDALPSMLGGSWSDRRVRYLFQMVQTNNLMDLAAWDGTELCLRLDFDCRKVGDVFAQQTLQHLTTLLEEMASNPDRRVGG